MDALNGITEYDYDVTGQLTSVKDAMGGITTYTYNKLGFIDSITDDKGVVTQYEYNANGQITKIIKPDGTTESYIYDKNGNLIKYINAKGVGTVYKYDNRDRLLSTKNALGGLRAITYTATGKIAEITDEKANKTIYKYDELDRLIEVIDANGAKTRYVYDSVNNLVEVHQIVGITQKTIDTMELLPNTQCPYTAELTDQVTKYKYDSRGLLIEEVNPANKVMIYTYDANGNLITKTDREGYMTKYEYDPVNNLKKVIYADGKQAEYAYNLLNQVIGMNDWLGKTTYELDALGRLIKVKDYEGKQTEYTWSTTNEKQSIKYPDASTVTYNYDSLGRLLSVKDAQNKVTTYKYDKIGNVTEKLLPNGIRTHYQYDDLSRLTHIDNYTKNNKIMDSYLYSYDATGNKTKIRRDKYVNDFAVVFDETEGTTQYKYDQLNQLIEVSKPNRMVEKYFYDTVGNRVRQENWILDKFINASIYNYDIENRLIKVEEKANTSIGKKLLNHIIEMEYDQRGNLIRTNSEGRLLGEYTFDTTNKLTDVTNILGIKTNFTYNGVGERVKMIIDLPKPNINAVRLPLQSRWNEDKQEESDRCSYLYNGKDYKLEYNYALDITKPYDNVLLVYGKGVDTQRYTYGLGVLSLDNSSENSILKSVFKNANRGYYLQDEMGSPIRIVGEAGNTKAIYSYDIFGRPIMPMELIKQIKAKGNIYSYTGYQYDLSTGLMYAQARYYMPKIGRFISEDRYKGQISNPQSLNFYRYANANPLKYIDPTGFWSIWVQKYSSGNTSLSVEFEDSKLLSTLNAGINALPLGSAFDYADKIEDVAGVITTATDGFGGLTDMYKYKPDADFLNRVKKWDTIAPTVNDILDKADVYQNATKKLTSSAAKNIVKNGATIVTAGFVFYDGYNRYNGVEKDRYLRGMIRAANLEDTLNKIENPDDMYIMMTFIEEKLNSYGANDYKLFNKYFGSSYFGLNDYTIEPSWWDNLWGNGESVKQDIENTRDIYNNIAKKLEEDFADAIKCK